MSRPGMAVGFGPAHGHLETLNTGPGGGRMPPQISEREFFPLPTFAMPDAVSGVGRRTAQRVARRRKQVAVCNEGIESLNWMSGHNFGTALSAETYPPDGLQPR